MIVYRLYRMYRGWGYSPRHALKAAWRRANARIDY